ncbi:hypothetical protein [Serratia sp. D1N4]
MNSKKFNDLYFKDNVSAFEYACKYSVTDIRPKQGLIAIVEDEPDKDGNGDYYCTVKVSSDDGGFIVPSAIATKEDKVVIKGSLVIWVPYEHSEIIASTLGDDRKGWVGFIVATVKPTLKNDSGWQVDKRLV